MQSDHAEDQGDGATERVLLPKPVQSAIIGLFILAFFAVLYLAQALFIPVTLAFLFALVLSPVVRAFRKRGIPEAVTAALLVLVMAAVVSGGIYTLSGPISKWVANAPEIALQLRYKLSRLREPLEEVKKAQKQVEQATQQPTDPNVQQVVVQQPGFLSRAAEGVPEVAAGIVLGLVLLLFLLASGDLIYEKVVGALPTLTDKKRGLRIVKDVEREVSRYLFTISIINCCLGAVIGTGLYFIGMPNPALWGVCATFLNFIPYVGAISGIVIVGAVAAVSFPSIGSALLAPGLYALCTFFEGQIITPALLGRRLQMNGVAIFLAIALWGWLWGFIGIFIAVPMLIVLKVFSRHVSGLHSIEELLSERRSGSSAQEGA